MNGGILPSSRTDSYNTEGNTVSISEGGNSCGYVNWNSERFFSGGHNFTLQNLSEKIIPFFLYQALKYKQKELMSLRVGSGLPNIQKKDLENYQICYPSKIEQKRIEGFFRCIDLKIAKQQHLIETLKKYKRGALKAVFSQKVCFSSDPQNWEKYKMRELINLQSGQDFPPSEYNNQGEGIPYMTGASCIVKGKTVVSRWTKTPRCYAYKGETLLVCKGSGSGTVVMLSQDKVHIARQFMSLRAKEQMTSKFCYYLTVFLSDRIKQNATGLIEGINRGTVLSQNIFLPPVYEQEQIANFFSKLDDLLSFHEELLDRLIANKEGLLQQLFI